MAPEQRTTPESLINGFQSRSAYRSDLGNHINSFQERLVKAKAVLNADRYNDVQTMYEVLKQAIIQDRPECVNFARAFIDHIVEGGKPEEFFNLEKNKQYQNLDIDPLVTSSVQKCLEAVPLQGLLDLVTSGAIEKSLLQIPSGEEIIEIDSKLSKTPESGIVKKETKTYSAIDTLFKTDYLWVHHCPAGSTHEKRFTNLYNIAVLLTGNNWNDQSLKATKIAIQQTVILNYKKQKEFNGITLSNEGHGGNLRYYSEDQVRDLIVFMQEFLPTSKSPYRITSEAITRWPLDFNKKKRT